MNFIINKVKLLTTAVFGSLLFIMSTTTSFAHVSLKSTNPAQNATIQQSPKDIALSFDGEVMLMHVRLFDAQQKSISLNFKPTREFKKSFSIPAPQLKKGKYTVKWMLMGKDGHHMNGEYTFTIQ